VRARACVCRGNKKSPSGAWSIKVVLCGDSLMCGGGGGEYVCVCVCVKRESEPDSEQQTVTCIAKQTAPAAAAVMTGAPGAGGPP
jgi:hypothetical protein